MILDLFAGPGGWSEGLRMLGLSDIGIEWDAAACATRAAASHRTIRADVTSLPAAHLRGEVDLLIASPPCTAFSMAGAGAGREVLDRLCAAAATGDWYAMRDEHPMVVWAPLDVGRWIDECRPTSIALEQVPPAAPLWEALGHWLRGKGYNVWTDVLNAANYGVPQTRKRAILTASLTSQVARPHPTHEKDPGGLFGLVPWISMASALGWGADLCAGNDGRNATVRSADEPAPTLAFGNDWGQWAWRRTRGKGVSERHGERPDTPITEPAPTLTSKSRSDVWVVDRRTNSKAAGGGMAPTVVVPMSEPAPTFTSKSGTQWIFSRPATTVCADPRLPPPGFRGGRKDYELDPEYNVRSGDGAIKITVPEASILQSFREDYPWQGSRSKQFEQVGNAVPPLLAAHVLASLLGIAVEAAA